MIFTDLNSQNFPLFAIKNYENPQAVTRADFDKDLQHFKYIKRLLKRYKNTGVLKTHLILNHLIVLFNVFNDATVPLLLYNLEKDLWPAIKSFLMFLNRIPEYPPSTLHKVDEDQVCVTQLNEEI